MRATEKLWKLLVVVVVDNQPSEIYNLLLISSTGLVKKRSDSKDFYIGIKTISVFPARLMHNVLCFPLISDTVGEVKKKSQTIMSYTIVPMFYTKIEQKEKILRILCYHYAI